MLELKEIDGEDYGKDLVEVVRCKDCRYGIKKDGYISVTCCFDSVCGRLRHPFDFCSDGRKKDDFRKTT